MEEFPSKLGIGTVTDIYALLQRTLDESGPTAAMDALIDSLRKSKQFHQLFDALTLRTKSALGIPLAGGESATPPSPEIRRQLEDRLVESCREVGKLLIEEGDLAGAYSYFHMIGELEPLRDAIESATPAADEVAPLIDIALNRGVHPARGVSLVLEHYGLCQAISACESLFAAHTPGAVRKEGVERIIVQLHHDLKGRLEAEIVRQEGKGPASDKMTDWLEGRDWLFVDDNYHIDTSHLNAAVRMARLIEPSPVFRQCLDLCAYGQRLSSRYCYPDPEPFGNVYVDSQRYFRLLLGEGSEDDLRFFREKAEQLDPAEVGTYPTEVYVRLLRSLDRRPEAIAFVREREVADSGPLAGLLDSICEEVGDYAALAASARRRANLPGYLSALLAARSS